ncbi:D-inositol 3-phosphate glycosyltransferase-like isoform X3 [Acropora muricata]|uniref:D-inositol 3-phosphate glycosyltransferase-like isoform X3 n=1 Tax=Acropora muricata TaxID=159855 RepID=UPI0034E40DB9
MGSVVHTSHGSIKVTILASEWGSSKGGLSTINRELAIQLAKFSCLEVTFFLPKCSDEDKKAAESHGISIVVAKRRPGYNELDWLSFPPEHLMIDVIVGHGVKLGRQAQVIRDYHKCKWVQVVHTDPEELGMFKCYENPISTGEEKHYVGVELCKMADLVVGVGPKLAEACRKYLSFCKKPQEVFEFTPGVFDDFSSVEQVPDERKQCSVLVFGRGDAKDFKLKGFDIAAHSVAAMSDTTHVFVGAPHGKHEEIALRFIDRGIPANRLRVRGFMEREALKQLFCEVDLVLMPSRTEGFGLTGLEALSAGLPVIVSKNSGFGEALGSIPNGPFFVMDPEYPSTWTVAIKDMWDKDRKSRLDEVKALRDSYSERYSWPKQCKDLIEKMFELLYVSAGGAQGMRPRSNAVSRKCRKPPNHAAGKKNPDQPSVSAGGAQGMRPRTNAVSRECRKPPTHAAREENQDQPSGAQSGHEKKRSLSDHQETFIRSSSGSTSDEFLPREGPDQPEEATGPQRKWSRGNSLPNSLRKQPIPAVKEGYIGQDNSSFKVPGFGLCKCEVKLNYSIYSGRARLYTC